MTSIPLVDVEVTMAAMSARVVEAGTNAYVSPPVLSGSLSIWSAPTTAYAIGADAKPRPRKLAIGCRPVVQSVLADSTIYAIVNESCSGVLGKDVLVRVTADGHTEQVALPYLVKQPSGYRAGTAEEKGAIGCEATSIVLRPPSDLWVELWCASNPTDRSLPAIPAVVRRGHPQTPLTLP